MSPRTVLSLSCLIAAGPLAAQSEGVVVPPVTRWVGAGAACHFASLQAAINASADHDVIRIANNQNYANQMLVINNRSLTLSGGYASCGDAEPSAPTTVLHGNGNASVLRIATGAAIPRTVLLRRLAIWDGGTDADGGGGIDVSGPVQLTLDGVDVVRNESSRGGGLRVQGSGIAHTRVRLDGGSDIGSSQPGFGNSASVDGGGIHCTAATIELRNGTVHGNDTAGNGGGLYLDGCHLAMVDLAGVSVPISIADNAAGNRGGGLHAVGGSQLRLRSTAQQRMRIQGNLAGGGGGGVSLLDAGTDLQADGVQIIGNETNQFGGGVLVADGARLDMDRGSSLGTHCPAPDSTRCSVLAGNSALSGGAIAVSTGAEADIRQTWIEDNTAATEAVARVFDASLVFDSNLVRGNLGSAFSMLFAQNALGTIGWSTLVDNGAFTAVRASGGSLVALVGSIIWQDVGLAAAEADGGIISGQCLSLFEDSVLAGDTSDPLFVSPGAVPTPDHALRADSSAVDACAPLGGMPLGRDAAGHVRPFDLPGVSNGPNTYDRGALETGDRIFADGFPPVAN